MTLLRDERTLRMSDRVAGVLGPRSTTFTLAWLAIHRDRLRTVILGGHRLTVLFVWDRHGQAPTDHSDADEDAIYQIVYGEPPPDEPGNGAVAA